MVQDIKQLILKRKILDKSRLSPQFVDEALPTVPVRLVKQIRGVNAGTVIGSHFVGSAFGSPAGDATWKIGYQRFNVSGSTARFAITHSRKGTIDLPFFEGAGDEVLQSDPYREPIHVFTPGSVRVRLLTSGTVAWYSAVLVGPED